MRIAILGASGFVGSALCAHLVKQGHELILPSRNPQRAAHLRMLPGAQTPLCDYSQASLQAVLGEAQAVINLVGILNESGHSGAGFYAVHEALPQRIIDACQALGIRRLLHMSALHADAERGSSHYLRSKGAGEARVRDAGLEATWFRPSVIFGPGDSFFNRFASLLRMTPGVFPLACPDARFAPVYVGDVVMAFSHALSDRHSIGQGYDLCGPRSYRLEELVRFTDHCLGRRHWILRLPHWAARLQAQVMEYLPGKPFSKDNLASLRTDSVCEEEHRLPFGLRAHSIEAVVPDYLPHSLRSLRHDRHRLTPR